MDSSLLLDLSLEYPTSRLAQSLHAIANIVLTLFIPFFSLNEPQKGSSRNPRPLPPLRAMTSTLLSELRALLSSPSLPLLVFFTPAGLFGFHHLLLGHYGRFVLYLFTFGVYGCGWLYDLFHLQQLVKESSSWSSGSRSSATPGLTRKAKNVSPSAASPTLLLSAPATFPSPFPPSPDKHVMLSSSSSSSSPSSLFSPVKAADQHDSALLGSRSEEEGGEERQETAALPPSPTLQLVRASTASMLCSRCLQALPRSSVVAQDSDSPLPSFRHIACLDAATVAAHAPGRQYSLIAGWEQLRDDEKGLVQKELNAVLEQQQGGAALPSAQLVKSAELQDADVYIADSEQQTVRVVDKREQEELRHRQPARKERQQAHSAGRGGEEVNSSISSSTEAPQVVSLPAAVLTHTEASASPHAGSGVVISAPVMSSAPSPSSASSTAVFVTCSSCGVGKSVDDYSVAELRMQQGRARCSACCQAEAEAADRQEEIKNGGSAAGNSNSSSSSSAHYRLRGRRGGAGGSAAGRRR